MKHKVLIPLDGSEFSRQILPYVREFHSPDETALILLRVVARPHGRAGKPARPVFGQRMTSSTWALATYEKAEDARYASHPIFSSQEYDSRRAQLRDELQPLVRRLEEWGYTVSADVRFGDPAIEILTFAAEEDVNLIAMATHGRTGASRLTLGSIAQDIVHYASAPVLLFRPFDRADDLLQTEATPEADSQLAP